MGMFLYTLFAIFIFLIILSIGFNAGKRHVLMALSNYGQYRHCNRMYILKEVTIPTPHDPTIHK